MEGFGNKRDTMYEAHQIALEGWELRSPKRVVRFLLAMPAEWDQPTSERTADHFAAIINGYASPAMLWEFERVGKGTIQSAEGITMTATHPALQWQMGNHAMLPSSLCQRFRAYQSECFEAMNEVWDRARKAALKS